MSFFTFPVEMAHRQTLARRRIPNSRKHNNDLRSQSPESALDRAMREWGVTPEKKANHKEFFDDMMDYVKETEQAKVDGELNPQPPDYPQLLSDDPQTAMEQVLLQEFGTMLSEQGLWTTVDNLKEYGERNHIPFPDWPPFFCQFKSGEYVTKDDFARAPATLLDPLERFSFQVRPVLQQLRDQIQDRSDSSSDAYCKRALVAQNACKPTARCVNCRAEGKVRWNAIRDDADQRYWKRLVCTNCGSSYEIKTKKDIRTINKKLQRGVLEGGTFYTPFLAVQEELPNDARQYLCVCSRETTVDSKLDTGWPVYVVEIDRVQPDIKARSFHIEHVDKRKIYTKILLKEDTDSLWFNIPFFEYDPKVIAGAILDKLEEQQVSDG